MVLVDNSEYSRDGDTQPNRLSAQLECVSSITNRSNNDNHESSVGLMTTAGHIPEILTTPASEPASVTSLYSKIKINGFSNVLRAIQVAMLAMKHRNNKNSIEKVVLFVASALRVDEPKFMALATEIRRNNVGIDIINVCCESNMTLLKKFHDVANAGGQGKLINHPAGVAKLLATIQSSLYGQNARPTAQAANDFDDDQEYQMAIQMSLQEAEKNQTEREKAAAEANKMNVEKDSETESLLKKADEISQSKQESSSDNSYRNDPQFIKEVIQDLNLNVDQDKITQNLKKPTPDDKNKKPQTPEKANKKDQKKDDEPESKK